MGLMMVKTTAWTKRKTDFLFYYLNILTKWQPFCVVNMTFPFFNKFMDLFLRKTLNLNLCSITPIMRTNNNLYFNVNFNWF